MPPSAVINDGYNRQIVLLHQIVATNINNTSKNINESYQIRAQCIIRFQFLINNFKRWKLAVYFLTVCI